MDPPAALLGSSTLNPVSDPSLSISTTSQSGCSVLASYSVIAKTICGSVMLSLAYTANRTGLIFACPCLLVSGVAGLFTLHLLNRLTLEYPSDSKSFSTLTRRLCPDDLWVVDVGLAVLCFGMALSDLQVPGTLLAHLLLDWFPDLEVSYVVLRRVVLCVIVVSLFPVIAVKRLTVVATKDFVGMLINIYVAFLAIYYLADPNTHPNTSAYVHLVPGNVFSFFASLPVYLLAFCGHQNALTVNSEIRDFDKNKLDFISTASVASALILYLPAMLVPGLTLGDAVQSNFMKNLQPGSAAVQLGLFLNALAIAGSFPLQCHPCRRAVISLLTKDKELDDQMERRFRYSVSLVLATFCLLIAYRLESLGPVFELTGAIGANLLAFIMPCRLYLASGKSDWRALWARRVHDACVYLLGLGTLGILGTWVN